MTTKLESETKIHLTGVLRAVIRCWAAGQHRADRGDEMLAEWSLRLPADEHGHLREELCFGARCSVGGWQLEEQWGALDQLEPARTLCGASYATTSFAALAQVERQSRAALSPLLAALAAGV